MNFFFIIFLALKGTPDYFAPELWNILNKKEKFAKYDPKAADIYALGIICIELIIGETLINKLKAERYI